MYVVNSLFSIESHKKEVRWDSSRAQEDSLVLNQPFVWSGIVHVQCCAPVNSFWEKEKTPAREKEYSWHLPNSPQNFPVCLIYF